MTIRRVNHGKYHTYVDSDTGEKIPGVTRATDKGLPKAALVDWAANVTIDYAIDNWYDLSHKPISERIKELRRSRYSDKDAAANRGNKVHELGARLVAGEKVAIPEGIEGHVEAYTRFLDEFDVAPILVERVIVSHRHRYCGTLDLLADLLDPDDPDPDPATRRRVRWLLDIKTSRSGVFGETALQLAGYRYADAWVNDDGTEHELPEVDRTGAVHVTAKGYELVPVEAGERQHRQFLYAQQIAVFVEDESRGLVGSPIAPPRTSTFRLERS